MPLTCKQYHVHLLCATSGYILAALVYCSCFVWMMWCVPEFVCKRYQTTVSTNLASKIHYLDVLAKQFVLSSNVVLFINRCTCPISEPTLCSKMCTDTLSDSSNCGGCGISCNGGECSSGEYASNDVELLLSCSPSACWGMIWCGMQSQVHLPTCNSNILLRNMH